MEEMPTLHNFLESLKLSSCSNIFQSHNIKTVDELIMHNFDDDALKHIGIEKLGYRKRIINELKTIRKRLESNDIESVPSKHKENEPAVAEIPTRMEEEVNVGHQETETSLFVNEEEPPVLPKKKGKPFPPIPPPRISPPVDPSEIKDPNSPISANVVQTVEISEEIQKGAKTCDPVESPKANESPLFATVPDIPPRIDLIEKPADHQAQKILSGELSRSKTFPVKRPAPAPPVKATSMKVKTDTENDLCTIKEGENTNGANNGLHAIEKDTAENMAQDMRPTSLSIVKDRKFLGKIDSLMQSPRGPVPVTRKTATSQPFNENDEQKSSGTCSEMNESMDEAKNQETSHGNKQQVQQDELALANITGSRTDLTTKAGFLDKRGGKNNTKPFQKRWVVFNGNDLRYYKPNDKDAKSDCLQIVPLYRMKGVKIDQAGRRSVFCLETPNRTFLFASDDHREIGLWANALMKAIVLNKQSPTPLSGSTVGGKMADPDKEGWLKKQGHNVAKDWKERYVVVKDGKLAYYRSYEDYTHTQDLSLNLLNMALSRVMPDQNRFRITIKTAQQKDFTFEADDEASYCSWVTAFETSIQFALGDPKILEALQENPANKYCADCRKRNPVWASVNLLVAVCENCIGFHRKLGAQISKARSILMDESVWTSSLKRLMQSVGNEMANSFWEYKLPDDDRITPDCSSDERYDFIVSKYKEKKYINFSQFYGQAADLGNALRKTVITNDVLKTLQLIICGASVYYTEADSEDQRTPFELANAADQELQMELIRQFNGHLTAEEREEQRKKDEKHMLTEAVEVAATPSHAGWEKQGVLLKRGPRNSEQWKKRIFYLQKRSLYYQTDRERELIDLKKATDVQLGANDNDPATINIILPNRTFYLKGESVCEAKSWYWAIKNKQVFGVDIKNQDLNSKNVPLIVAKCIDFVEYNALQEEGIYRRNGSLITIKNLKLMFDQDAPSVRLTIEDYPNVHDVCCLLKLYLREGLPEPLMTQNLYKSLVENAAQTDHNSRLTTLYELIRNLPEVNLSTLTRIVLHLNKVIQKCEENRMSKENVNRIFAPIILNQGNSTQEQMLNREYAVFDDILTYDTYFFDIDPFEESKRDQEIENAKKVISDAMTQKSRISEGCKIDEIQVAVSIEGIQESPMVKVSKKTTASEVCWYIIKLLSLSFDANWSLFEKISAAGLERPLHTKDLVFPLIMESSKWEGGNWMLTLKNNYVAEMTAVYQDNKLNMCGKLHWRKNDSNWKECYAKIKTGDLVISGKEHGSEIEKLPLHQWLLYIGTDERGKKKSPKKYGLMLMNGSEKRDFSTDDEKYLYRWISAILRIKYPSGIWTNLRDAARRMTLLTEDLVPINQRKSVFLGRQSTYIREEGSSSHIQREIQVKRRSLKKIR